MKNLFLAAIVIFSTCTARAQIGETLDKCIERYGSPLGAGSAREPVIFRQGPGLMFVTFEGGKACQFDFQSPRSLTDNEVERLQTIATGGTTWRRAELSPKGPVWESADGKLISFHFKEEKVVSVQLRR